MTMKKAKIYYFTLTDEMRKEEKLDWFRSHSIEQIEFHHIQPDKNSNWINLSEDNDWEELLPLTGEDDNLFLKYYMGVVTNRDEWVYDFDENKLIEKIKFFIEEYNLFLEKNEKNFPTTIKWSDTLKRNYRAKREIFFNKNKVKKAYYRPFNICFLYAEKLLIDRLTENHFDAFGKNLDQTNFCFGIIGKDTVIPFSVMSFRNINDLNSLSNAAGGNKTFSFYRYDKDGNRIDNITDWALEQFRNHYQMSEPGFSGVKDKQDEKKGKKSGKSVRQKEADAAISKEDIFYYTYAVLHNPAYRKKYERNLKREFPRLPFYPDFRKWANWGKSLMNLHIHYETVKPFPLKQIDRKIEHDRKLKVKLKADKAAGVIELDEQTSLHGIPPQVWEYRLGNRSALEWILDQYREKKSKDPTIAEKFNTYRFSDYKEHVIDLLRRVCTVSVETMKIVDEMKQ